MSYIVKMPKLGMDMDQGTIVEWFVDEGDEVTEGEVVAEIESEKTTGEITVREDGIIHERLLNVGDSTGPGGAVAIVGAPDEDVSDLLAETGVEANNTATETVADEPTETTSVSGNGKSAVAQVDVKATPRAKRRAEEVDIDLATVEGTGPQGAVTADDVDEAAAAANEETASERSVKASPRAKRRAEELEVDLSTVEGTGPQGTVTADDVEAAANTVESEPASPAPSTGESETASTATGQGQERVFASPRVRRLARELGVDIESVDGTGVGGAITEPDVRAADDGVAASTDKRATEHTEPPGTRDEERPLGSMRRTIANRLGQSYQNAVHVTIHRTAAAADLLAAAKAAKAGLDAAVSVNDVLLLAVSATLDAHPEFNATAEDKVHQLHEEHNICVAVDIDAGLVAPVVRTVDQLSLSEVTEERRAVTDRALAGEHTMSDLTGGTFTISNLGGLGVESFDPIINPPQVAILGVDAIADDVVPGEDGEPTVEKRIGFDLSFDHRFVDGADAARFMQTLVTHVEDPWPLVVEASAR
ncbi:2-oxo acid dehydrogenase subunit E2 [Halomarina rubra]|uniref:2-oxo acid dehydrogenase subunit E2 n=1 Tax=Halomarina rubra TaxID=2071873 RepID=A0ABD6AV51_9EURY|nr:2-oxo acid dehydrogenase subunit E2 [Halomarina rubra]